MFCTNCGAAVTADAPVCPTCGLSIARSGVTARLAFHGNGADLLLIYIKYVLLSVVTLGIYSFWGRTNVRRYLWSQTSYQGERFVWHGTGEELLVGWLKALLLFLPLYLQFGLLFLLLGENLGSILGGLVFLLGLCLLLPAILVGGWRYRMSRTSLRGIRFAFDGTVAQAWPMLLRNGVLLLVTLGLYTPWFLNNLRQFLTQHTRYGTLRFRYEAPAEPLFPPFLVTILLFVPTLSLIRFYFQAASFRHFWNGTELSSARFESGVRALDLLAITVVNFLLVLVTFGVAYPWTRVRLACYYSERLWLNNAPDLSMVREESVSATATGQELAHVLDIDGIDFSVGF